MHRHPLPNVLAGDNAARYGICHADWPEITCYLIFRGTSDFSMSLVEFRLLVCSKLYLGGGVKFRFKLRAR